MLTNIKRSRAEMCISFSDLAASRGSANGRVPPLQNLGQKLSCFLSVTIQILKLNASFTELLLAFF